MPTLCKYLYNAMLIVLLKYDKTIVLHTTRGLASFLLNTVEPLNKGHVGDNIDLAVLSFIERLIVLF